MSDLEMRRIWMHEHLESELSKRQDELDSDEFGIGKTMVVPTPENPDRRFKNGWRDERYQQLKKEIEDLTYLLKKTEFITKLLLDREWKQKVQ